MERMAKLLYKRMSSILQKEPSTEDENNGGQVRILVYDKTKEGDHKTCSFHKDETCQDVCRKLGEKFNISPAMLHCFSLAALTKSGSGCLWLGPFDKLGSLVNGETVHFRMRFIPAKDKCDKELLDENCLCYLYWQMKWDFLHDKLEAYKKKDKKKDKQEASRGLWDFLHDKLEAYKKKDKKKDKQEASRGVVVLCILITVRIETENTRRAENLKEFWKNNNIKNFFPNSLESNVLGQLFQTNGVRKNVKKCQKNYPRTDSTHLMTSCIKHLLGEDHGMERQNYYIEYYNAHRKGAQDKPADLQVVIQMDNHASVTIRDKTSRKMLFTCLLEDVDAIEMNPDGDHYKVGIRKSAQTENVYFGSRLEAISCVTCMETFCRLACDFYDSLCPDVEPSDLKIMKKLRVHGPVTNDFVKQKLQKREKSSDSGSKENVYILRASLKTYDEYEVLYKDDRSGKLQLLSLGKVVDNWEDYRHEATIGKLKHLISNAIKEKGTALIHWMRVNPQSEGCDVLQNILLEDNPVNMAEEEEEEAQAKVYKSSSLQLQNLIGQGHFTETYEAKLCSTENVVSKQLRYTEIPDASFRQVQESFQDSFDRLQELKNPKFFVKFVGMVTARTPAVLMKQYNHGNLCCFLQSRVPREHQLTLRHLCDVLVQLVSALDYMDQNSLCHGNLHCDNILVDKFERNGMTVLIADPGLINLYNKLGLDANINKRRLPWIAPELYDNLFRTTIKTDMFAFGTTLWQMFSDGKNPLDVDPALKGKSVQEICEYFSSPEKYLIQEVNFIRPLILREKKDDSHDIRSFKDVIFSKLMKLCWTIDPEERITPKNFLRVYNNHFQSYGSEYHDYNIITDEVLYPVMSGTSALWTGSSNDSSGVVSSIQTREMPRYDLRLLSGQSGTTNGLSAMSTAPVETQASPVNQQIPPVPGSPSTRVIQGGNTPIHNEAGTNVHVRTPTGLGPAPVGLGVTHTGPGPAPTGHGTAPGAAQRQQRSGPLPGLPVSYIRHLIPEDRLTINWDTHYGQGHYGAIYKGKLAPTSNLGLLEPTQVAVKVLKDNVVNEFGHEFVEEAKVMERLDHKNIVKFYGVSRQAQYLIMEFVDEGCLYKFVMESGDRCAPETFLKFCVDIASGMEYLSEMKVLHRDLAARNVLITSNLDAKISDFGMSKVLAKDEEFYRRPQNVDKNMPVLWSAPEWIGRKKFTTKSDVWSFGVVLWEVYSKGRIPNICKDLDEFKKMGIKNLRAGHRLAKPERCSDEVYQLMKHCWDYDPEKRPTFSDCHDRLKVIAGIVDEDCSQDSRDDYSVTNTNNRLVPNTQRHKNQLVVNGNIAPSPQATATVTRTGVTDNHVANGNSTAPPIVSSRTQQGLHVNGGVFSVPITTTMLQNGHGDATPSRQSCFLDKAKLKTGTKLGQGGFGEVYKGNYNGRPVAVKRCTRKDEYGRFRREIDLLNTLSHRNIIESIGAIHNGEADIVKLELVLEFMDRGSLSSCLKNTSCPMSRAVKVDCLIQVAEALCFLYQKKILHGDLTADNVLVSGENDELVAKISDFGWAKQLEGNDVELSYKRLNAKFRVLWAAYEALTKHTYTKYSDIWSYGSLAIEVFGDGKLPDMVPPLRRISDTGGINGDELVKRLKNERFAQPSDCPNKIFSIITKCWLENPVDRIKPIAIVEALESFRAGMNNQM